MKKITLIIVLLIGAGVYSQNYNIKNIDANTKYSDFGVTYYGENTAIYASSKKTKQSRNRKWYLNSQPFLDLYKATVTNTGEFTGSELFSKDLNTKMHESNVTFTKDLKTVYFSRDNYNSKKYKTDDKGWVLIQLYKADIDAEGNWKNITKLPFNSDQFDTGHPSLNANDNKLYFTSNRPGSMGLTDIWAVDINKDGTYSEPYNLGPEVNTVKSEMFPHIDADNVLYYSSDGKKDGNGGLDIYAIEVQDKKGIGEAVNLGFPINSAKDDFSLVFQSGKKIGHFSSNREGGKGNDDIYKFVEQIPLPYNCKQIVSGVITDEETKEVLANAKVTLFDEDMNVISDMIANEKGEYKFEELECEKTYFVRAESKDYETVETSVVTGSAPGETTAKLPITKRVKQVGVGSDLAKAFDIKIIYFDLDKSNIRPDAALQLEKILQVMKQYPTMKVDVRSHTDCRQTAKYNQALSDRRAKSTIAWLVKNGVAADRLTGKGYGESQLVNDCGCEPTNESKCSEEEHQANRRSEFIITAM